jgi:lipoate-protein ligase B
VSEIWRVDLGRRPYRSVWELQKRLVERRIAGLVPDLVLLVEHDPVVTLGRSVRGARASLAGVPVYEVERGGDLTYHGPGQLVGYPILQLEGARRDLHRYLRDLEEVLLRALARFGIRAERNPGLTGVWAGGRKLASIGVAVRRWVTYHGFALNVSTDLSAFQSLEPCKLPGAVMGSMAEALGYAPALAEVAGVLAEELEPVFGARLVPVEPSRVLGGRAVL